MSMAAGRASDTTAAMVLNQTPKKLRILCLHGKYQNGPSFSNKIAGARRKLSRAYDLHFLDGPIVLAGEGEEDDGGGGGGGSVDSYDSPQPLAWWLRDELGKHSLIREAFEHVIQATDGQPYDALLGFSQGGTLATALAVGGIVPGVRAVVTAGAPIVEEAFVVAEGMATSDDVVRKGLDVPKLHLAGERDGMVPVESTRGLCQRAGNGELVVHEQGHLFPTRAVRVNRVMEFLAEFLGGR